MRSYLIKVRNQLSVGRILRSSVKYQQPNRKQLLRKMLSKYKRFLQTGITLQARQSSQDPRFRRHYSRYNRRSKFFGNQFHPQNEFILKSNFLFLRETHIQIEKQDMIKKLDCTNDVLCAYIWSRLPWQRYINVNVLSVLIRIDIMSLLCTKYYGGFNAGGLVWSNWLNDNLQKKELREVGG